MCIGEIVWDMLPDGRYLGGAPLNVAVNLYRLGVPVHMISAVGTDGLGDEEVRLLGDRISLYLGFSAMNYPPVS